MLDSPVKRDSGKNLDENVVYIFTKLPDTAQELNRFLGVASAAGSAQSKVQHNHIYDEVMLALRSDHISCTKYLLKSFIYTAIFIFLVTHDTILIKNNG